MNANNAVPAPDAKTNSPSAATVFTIGSKTPPGALTVISAPAISPFLLQMLTPPFVRERPNKRQKSQESLISAPLHGMLAG
jgi:hypothetical protein